MIGLGYNVDLKELKELKKESAGHHHIKRMIEILEGKYKLDNNFSYKSKYKKNIIILEPIKNYLNNCV